MNLWFQHMIFDVDFTDALTGSKLMEVSTKCVQLLLYGDQLNVAAQTPSQSNTVTLPAPNDAAFKGSSPKAE